VAGIRQTDRQADQYYSYITFVVDQFMEISQTTGQTSDKQYNTEDCDVFCDLCYTTNRLRVHTAGLKVDHHDPSVTLLQRTINGG